MKTYEEMAHSVMHRAKAHKKIRNRWIVGSVAAVCALGIGLGTLTMKPHTTTQQPTPMTEASIQTVEAPRVTFLYAAGDNTTEMKKGVTVPCRSQLRVIDVSGKTNDEIEAIAKKEWDNAHALVAAYPEAQGFGTSQYRPDGTPSVGNDHLVATYVHAGHFILNVPDWSLLESIQASTKNSVLILPGFSGSAVLTRPGFSGSDVLTQLGNPFAYPQTSQYYMNEKEINESCRKFYDGIAVNIGLGSGVVRYLNDHPTPLSQLSETFTFTFNFKDGTQETYHIDMIFNDNGEIYALYRGATADT